MRVLRSILSLVLCAILVLSSLLLVLGLLMRSRLFDASFYMGVIARPAYPLMVRQAILNDLEQQSNYVGVPLDVMESGLDDATLIMKQREHVANLAAFLNQEASFTKPQYPAELFYAPLEAFMKDYAVSHNLVFDAKQQEQLQDVAEDAAGLVQTHITLLDLSTLQNSASFQRIHTLVLAVSKRLVLASIPWLLALVLLIMLYRERWRSWLVRFLISMWLTGSLILVPSLVLERFQLHRRLALETPYLLFAVSHLLHDLLQFLIVWGLCLFVASSIGLVTTSLLTPVRKRSLFSEKSLRQTHLSR